MLKANEAKDTADSSHMNRIYHLLEEVERQSNWGKYSLETSCLNGPERDFWENTDSPDWEKAVKALQRLGYKVETKTYTRIAYLENIYRPRPPTFNVTVVSWE